VRVKVCGITRLRDAELASELGAWAIGFVFWPGSPRWIAAETARTIAARLPETVERVGVFANQPLEDVLAVSSLVGLDAVQLHGQEPPEFARALGRPVIKALSLSQTADGVGPHWSDVTILLDSRDPERLAEGGRTLDWKAAAPLAARRRIVLAGGLRPENVAEALRTVTPYAVDVSSGVEHGPGEKDPAKLRAFFDAVAEYQQMVRHEIR
jgi:phosphoribosylanthranilate isomerase